MKSREGLICGVFKNEPPPARPLIARASSVLLEARSVSLLYPLENKSLQPAGTKTELAPRFSRSEDELLQKALIGC